MGNVLSKVNPGSRRSVMIQLIWHFPIKRYYAMIAIQILFSQHKNNNTSMKNLNSGFSHILNSVYPVVVNAIKELPTIRPWQSSSKNYLHLIYKNPGNL